MPEGGPLTGLSHALSGLQHWPQGDGYSDWTRMHLLPIGILILTGVLVAWLAARREWVLLQTLLAIVLISHSQAFWRSVVRYDMPIWPFLAAPLLSVLQTIGEKDRVTNLDRSLRWAVSATLLILGVAGLVLQGSYAHLFVRGGWTF